MVLVTFIFILATALLSLCVQFGAQREIYWLVAIATSPILLLSFWKKPTLKSSQNIFAVVFCLAFACALTFAANNLVASTAFYSVKYTEPCFLGIFAAVSVSCGWLLSKITVQHYRLFVAGVIFAIAYCCVPQTSAILCAVCFVSVTVSASCILAAAIVLNKRITALSNCLAVKNVAPSLLLRNMAFSLTLVALFVALTVKYLDAEAMRMATLSSNVVCAVLLCVLTFTYLRQPLDFVSEMKFEILQEQRADIDNDALKEQLRERLSTFQNFPFAVWLKKYLSVFTRIKVTGLEKVTETATCFVANHYEIYGPYITVVKFPKLFMPWTEQAMTDKDAIAKQLRRGIDNISGKFVVKPIRKKVPQMVAKPLYRLVQFARPIPVYHHGAENFEKMLDESAQALNVGDSMMIFPEKPPNDQNYNIGGVDKLQTGFVEIAIAYKNLTGQDLSFYPLYIDKDGKQMIVGDKVSYNYDAPLHEEKTRVAEELYNRLDELYRQCENSRQNRRKNA